MAARELFERVEYPILMHCKSGADRVGLMSALYLPREARRADPRSQAPAVARATATSAKPTPACSTTSSSAISPIRPTTPMDFYDWVETVYDPEELKRSFHANRWANRIVDSVLAARVAPERRPQASAQPG